MARSRIAAAYRASFSGLGCFLYSSGARHALYVSGMESGKSPGDQEARKRAARIRVLIVDDSEVVREALRRHLREIGHCDVVGFAGDGAEALKQVETLRPDLVVMDLRMPVMNGLQATRRLKAMPEPPRIIICSLADEWWKRIALEAGADGFCSKSSLSRDLQLLIWRLFPDVAPSLPSQPDSGGAPESHSV